MSLGLELFTYFRLEFFMNQTIDEIANREFPCPRCKKPARWTDNPFRPFCSERCKMIDLGAWANEDYRVPIDESKENHNDFDEE